MTVRSGWEFAERICKRYKEDPHMTLIDVSGNRSTVDLVFQTVKGKLALHAVPTVKVMSGATSNASLIDTLRKDVRKMKPQGIDAIDQAIGNIQKQRRDVVNRIAHIATDVQNLQHASEVAQAEKDQLDRTEIALTSAKKELYKQACVCPQCDGKGVSIQPPLASMPDVVAFSTMPTCPRCHGSGKFL